MNTKSDYIKLVSGNNIPVTCSEYNDSRIPEISKSQNPALCYSPFTHMAINNRGYIRPCNHTSLTLGHVQEGRSLLGIWRGSEFKQLRQQMREYVLHDQHCKHCIHQLSTKQFKEAFCALDCDHMHTDEIDPPYPKRLTLELGNRCNLACITCNGDLSSRIRSERERRLPLENFFDDNFYSELEEIIPHVEHIAFYGGEPFIMEEVRRVFEIIERTGAQCGLTVSSNCTVLTSETKKYLEKLNFTSIAMSMDAVDDKLHSQVRCGVKGPVIRENHDWLIELARRRNFDILICATEHRKNWFQLPAIFEYAQEKDVYLHINHCVEPDNVTLYTLPTRQLQYVLNFLTEKKTELIEKYPDFRNLHSYDYLLGLVRLEIEGRRSDKDIALPRDKTNWLGTPVLGASPCETPADTIKEISHMDELDDRTRDYMLAGMLDQAHSISITNNKWKKVEEQIEGPLYAAA